MKKSFTHKDFPLFIFFCISNDKFSYVELLDQRRQFYLLSVIRMHCNYFPKELYQSTLALPLFDHKSVSPCYLHKLTPIIYLIHTITL